MLVVPTCQRGQLDLLNTGPDVDREKDRLLEVVRGQRGRYRKRLHRSRLDPGHRSFCVVLRSFFSLADMHTFAFHCCGGLPSTHQLLQAF